MARFVFEDETSAPVVPEARFVFEDGPAPSSVETIASHTAGGVIPKPAPGVISTLAGDAETALALGTGALAYPAGLLAMGEHLITGEGKEKARELRRDVESALTYQPRTEVGQQNLKTIAGAFEPWTESAKWVGKKVGEETGSDLTGGAAEEVFGAVVNPLSAVPMVKTLRAAPRGPSILRKNAESAAVWATNADRSAFRKAFGKPISEGKLHRTGAFLLDENVPLRSPSAMKDVLGSILDREGAEIGFLAAKADAQGAKVDLRAAVDRALKSPAIQGLKKNTETRALYTRAVEFLSDQLQQHGNLVPASVAHDIRMQLKPLSKWDVVDTTRPKPLADAYRAAYGSVNGEIAKAMRVVGLEKEWTAANTKFSGAATAKKLADVGTEQRAVNRFGQPSEKVAAVLGSVVAATGNPMALLAVPATVALNRGFFPATARSLNFASRLRIPGTPLPEVPLPMAAALARAIEEQAPEPRFRFEDDDQ